MQSYHAALGGDHVFSDRDYLSYSATYINSPSSNVSSGSGYKDDTPFDLWNKNRTAYYVNTYNLYHKHTFDPAKALETTFTVNLNGNRTQGDRNERYDEAAPSYEYAFDYDNFRLSSALEVNYNATFGDGHSFDLGSRTNYRNDRLHPQPQPRFRYREWTEYVYAGLNGSQGSSFLYSASLGTDLIFNRIQETNNHYIRLRPAASVKYTFNAQQDVGLAYRLENQQPTIGQLNPYNTSTDSLYRILGNPLLTPNKSNIFSAHYSFNRNGLYLSPEFIYGLTLDEILEMGRMDGNIFTQTYANEGRFTEWDAGLTFRYNHSRLGNIGGKAGYRRAHYSQVDRGSFYTNINFYLQYKKWSAYGYIMYQRYQYSPVYVRRNYAPESELTLNRKLNAHLTFNASMRYLFGEIHTIAITESAGYRSESIQRQTDRRFLPVIGFSYYWHNKVQTPYRHKKQLQQQESGISL
jgi:hypothetical protein